MPGTSFVARRCSFSILTLSFFLYGFQVWFAYKILGAVSLKSINKVVKMSLLEFRKILPTIATIMYASFVFLAVCCETTISYPQILLGLSQFLRCLGMIYYPE